MKSGRSADGTSRREIDRSEACSVELRAARIPLVGRFAHHHWLVVCRGDKHDRWEIWQAARAGGTSWGHLHLNLKPFDHGVGSGPGWMLHRWIETDAEEIAERIESSPGTYPFCHRYHYWPGPNSNTFVQWILRGRFSLGPRAIGRGYRHILLDLSAAACGGSPIPSRQAGSRGQCFPRP